jgi:hypothetical protein
VVVKPRFAAAGEGASAPVSLNILGTSFRDALGTTLEARGALLGWAVAYTLPTERESIAEAMIVPVA